MNAFFKYIYSVYYKNENDWLSFRHKCEIKSMIKREMQIFAQEKNVIVRTKKKYK